MMLSSCTRLLNVPFREGRTDRGVQRHPVGASGKPADVLHAGASGDARSKTRTAGAADRLRRSMIAGSNRPAHRASVGPEESKSRANRAPGRAGSFGGPGLAARATRGPVCRNLQRLPGSRSRVAATPTSRASASTTAASARDAGGVLSVRPTPSQRLIARRRASEPVTGEREGQRPREQPCSGERRLNRERAPKQAHGRPARPASSAPAEAIANAGEQDARRHGGPPHPGESARRRSPARPPAISTSAVARAAAGPIPYVASASALRARSRSLSATAAKQDDREEGLRNRAHRGRKLALASRQRGRWRLRRSGSTPAAARQGAAVPGVSGALGAAQPAGAGRPCCRIAVLPSARCQRGSQPRSP